jgi:hypothetical protein
MNKWGCAEILYSTSVKKMSFTPLLNGGFRIEKDSIELLARVCWGPATDAIWFPIW